MSPPLLLHKMARPWENQQLNACDFFIAFHQLTPLFFLRFFSLVQPQTLGNQRTFFLWTKRRKKDGTGGTSSFIMGGCQIHYILYCVWMWRTGLLFDSWLIAVISHSFFSFRFNSRGHFHDRHTSRSLLEKNFLSKNPWRHGTTQVIWWWWMLQRCYPPSLAPRVLNDFRRPRLLLLPTFLSLSLPLSHKI